MIRPARGDDVDELCAIDRRVLDDGRGEARTVDQADDPDRMRQRIGEHTGDDGQMLVVEVDGRPAGQGTVRRLRAGLCRHVAALTVAIDPAHQGRGLGRAVTAALVAWADGAGVERLELCVRADNDRAIRLYRSLGFAEETRRVAFFRRSDGTALDDLRMLRMTGRVTWSKAAAAVVRTDRGAPELCVFEHPYAGWQLPKGTIEPGEDPADAVVREVVEETGLDGCRLVGSLGAWNQHQPGTGELHRWHGFVLTAPVACPDRWDHVASGSAEEDGLVFALRWVPLALAVEVTPPLFHEVIRRAEAWSAR